MATGDSVVKKIKDATRNAVATGTRRIIIAICGNNIALPIFFQFIFLS
jgi:hypothetical protein